MKNLDTTLYFITDSTSVPSERFLPTVEAACKGGATLIQLREKNRSTREYMELATATHEITKRYNVPLIIDDRVDVALAIDAEGVHVGQTDMPVKIARQLMGVDNSWLWRHTNRGPIILVLGLSTRQRLKLSLSSRVSIRSKLS